MEDLLRSLRCFTVILALAVFISAEAFAEGVITVRENADIAGANVLVGDIATLTGFDKDTAEKIAGLNFCLTPAPDKTTVLSTRQIKSRLYNAGIDVQNADIQAPEKLTIHRKASVISGLELVNNGSAFLKKYFTWPEGTVEIESSGAPRDLILPYVADTTVNYILDNNAQKFGIRNFHAEVLQNGEMIRTVSLGYYLKVNVNVVSAANEISIGDTLTEDDLIFKKQNLASMRPGIYTSITDVAGKKVLRRLSKGDVITRAAVESTPDIVYGQTVSIVCRKPGIEITTKGKAMEKGFIGDTIKVTNSATKKVIKGVILDSRTVEITAP